MFLSHSSAPLAPNTTPKNLRIPQSLQTLPQPYSLPARSSVVRTHSYKSHQPFVSTSFSFYGVQDCGVRAYSYSSCSTCDITRSCAAICEPTGWARIESNLVVEPSVADIQKKNASTKEGTNEVRNEQTAVVRVELRQ
jgi:hypothetical protein